MNLNEGITIPFYVKVTILILGFMALFAILYIGRSLFIPLIFAVIIAILLNPLVNILNRTGMSRIIAIILTILIFLLFIIAFGGFLMSQASNFIASWPELAERFSELLAQSVFRISDILNVDAKKIDEIISSATSGFLNSNSALIGQTLTTFGSVMVAVVLVPVYIFLVLYYQSLLLEFLKRLIGESHHERVGHLVSQTKSVIQSYLVGLIFETFIIAILETATLAILGIKYAVLLGIIGALLNIIPYIGGIVAVILPMIIALATKSSAMYAVYVLVIYYIIQLFDNNIIVPRIVASKVRMNALLSIIVVIAGNALWGIPGMFLAIPILAILKLIFDNIESLQPWGFLLGDTIPTHPVSFKNVIKRRIKKPAPKT